VRAKVRNVDASFQGRIQYGGAFFALYLDAIDHKLNFSHDQIPLSFKIPAWLVLFALCALPGPISLRGP
jgi:hypothetical protein